MTTERTIPSMPTTWPTPAIVAPTRDTPADEPAEAEPTEPIGTGGTAPKGGK